MRPAAEALAEWASRYEHWLLTSALPLWWALGADHELGGFHELLDGNATAAPAPRRARVQTRQSFVYCAAHALGWKLQDPRCGIEVHARARLEFGRHRAWA